MILTCSRRCRATPWIWLRCWWELSLVGVRTCRNSSHPKHPKHLPKNLGSWMKSCEITYSGQYYCGRCLISGWWWWWDYLKKSGKWTVFCFTGLVPTETQQISFNCIWNATHAVHSSNCSFYTPVIIDKNGNMLGFSGSQWLVIFFSLETSSCLFSIEPISSFHGLTNYVFCAIPSVIIFSYGKGWSHAMQTFRTAHIIVEF